MKSITCTICKTTAEGNYCENCGQDVNNPDTTFWGMMKDMVSSALDVDKSVILNVFSIPFKPDKLIVNYWKGNRKYYPSPFKVLIYALAVAALHLAYVAPDFMGITLEGVGVDSHLIFWLVMLPLLTLTSCLAFIRRKMGFTKHLISILYIAGCFFILLILITDFIFLISGIELGMIIFLHFLLLVFLYNSIVFSIRKTVWIIGLNTIVQLMVFALILVLIFVILMNIPGAIETDNAIIMNRSSN